MSIKDFLLWQRRSTKADSQTTSPPSNQGLRMGETHGFSRRGFIHTAAGATALAFGPGLSLRALAHDDVIIIIGRYRHRSRSRAG